VPDKRTEHQWNKAIIGRLNKSSVNFSDNFDESTKCRFKLAVKERWQDNERTELVNIFAAGKDAKKMRSSRMGDLVFVKGLAKTGKYEKDGEIMDQILNLVPHGWI
jgi:single-stranded DNA-binding protein